MSVEIHKVPAARTGERYEVFETVLLDGRDGRLFEMELVPARGDDAEPTYLEFEGRAGVHGPGRQMLEGKAKLVVSAQRLLLLVTCGINVRGLDQRTNEIAIISVEREALASPNVTRGFSGKVKRVELSTLDGISRIVVSYLPSYDQFLSVLTPEHADSMKTRGQERVAERRHREEESRSPEALGRAAAQQQAREGEQRRREEEVTAEFDRDAVGGLGAIAGRVFDHRRTWRFRTTASPHQCIKAFTAAFEGSGGVMLQAKWEVTSRASGATAVYGGRAGVVGFITGLSSRAESEERGAIGSEVEFTVESHDDDHTVCAMWLALRGSTVGFTHDGRFIRPYLRNVANELREIDPDVQVLKD